MIKFRFFTVPLLLLMLCVPALSQADDAPDVTQQQPAQEEEAPPQANPAVELPKMQKILDKIKGDRKSVV